MRTRFTFERNSRVVVLVVVAITSSFARAQDAEAPKVDTGVPKANEATQAVEPTKVEEVSTRSPLGAAWLSIGSTALLSLIGGGMLAVDSEGVKIAGGVILGTGLVFGPSVGQLYSERWLKAGLFSLGRAASGAMFGGGFIMALGAAFSDNGHSSPGGGIALMVIGGLAETTLIIWGFSDSYESAEQFNEEHAKKSISLSPFVIPSAGRNGENGTAYGLAVAGRF